MVEELMEEGSMNFIRQSTYFLLKKNKILEYVYLAKLMIIKMVEETTILCLR
jgi:hypothetical protein